LSIDNGGNVISDGPLAIGSQANSVGNVSVDGIGSALAIGGLVTVGDASGGANVQPGGSLSVVNGAVVSAAGLTVGNQASSSGVVSVGGSGSRLSSIENIILGQNGAATLVVTNGGSVLATNGAGTTVAGDTGGSAVVSVSGPGSIFAAGTSLMIGQTPGITPFVNSSSGGAVLVGLTNSLLGSLGGFAVGSDGTVTLSVASNQLSPVTSTQVTPEIFTTGVLQFGGSIVVQTLPDTFIAPNSLLNGFIPLIEGNSANLASGLPVGLSSNVTPGTILGAITSPAVTQYFFLDRQNNVIDVRVPALIPLSGGTPEWFVPEVVQEQAGGSTIDIFGVQAVTPSTIYTSQEKYNRGAAATRADQASADLNLIDFGRELGQEGITSNLALGALNIALDSEAVKEALGSKVATAKGGLDGAAVSTACLAALVPEPGQLVAVALCGLAGLSTALDFNALYNQQLQADPFDPDYQQVFDPTLETSPIPASQVCADVGSAAQAAPYAVDNVNAWLNALYITGNRYGSAVGAGDIVSAALQANAFANDFAFYNASAQVAGANLTWLSNLLGASGIGTQLPTVQDESSALNSLDSAASMPFLDNVLGSLGFTEADISGLISEIEADPPALPTDTAVDALGLEAQTLAGSSVPEPGSLGLLGLAIAAFGVSVLWRGRAGLLPRLVAGGQI
jgi:T5SS/PEP-CTERM-associated repeat protein